MTTDNEPLGGDGLVERLLDPCFISDDDHRHTRDSVLNLIHTWRKERKEAANTITRLRAPTAIVR